MAHIYKLQSCKSFLVSLLSSSIISTLDSSSTTIGHLAFQFRRLLAWCVGGCRQALRSSPSTTSRRCEQGRKLSVLYGPMVQTIFSPLIAAATSVFCSTEMVDAGTTPTGDKLLLRGLMFHGFHGVKEEERKLGQKFLVDVDAWMDLRKAGKSDSLDDTVSYTAIYRIVKDVVEGSSHNLLESVAHLIASTTLAKHSQISAIRVKLGKPHVAVHGPLDYLGIEITRYRDIDGPT